MIKLDVTIIDEVGLSELPEEVKKKLFETFAEKLELNVGTVLSSQMTSEQLNEFMALIEAKKQDEAREWLEITRQITKRLSAPSLKSSKRT